MLRERELVKILSDSGSRILICQDDLYATVARAALPATAVDHTITTSALDFLAPGRPVPPGLARTTRVPYPGIVDLLDLVTHHEGEVPAPTAFTARLGSEAMGGHDLSSLTKVYTGGAPTPPGVLDEWYARTGTRIQPMYGLTEATSPTHMTPHGRIPPVDARTGVMSI